VRLKTVKLPHKEKLTCPPQVLCDGILTMDKATELVKSFSPTVHLRGYMLHRKIPDFSGQSNARLIPGLRVKQSTKLSFR